MKWFCSHDDEVISNYREPSQLETILKLGLKEFRGFICKDANHVTVVQCKKCSRVKHIVTTL